MYQISWVRPLTLNSQKCHIYVLLSTYPRGLVVIHVLLTPEAWLWFVSLYGKVLSRYKVVRNRTCTEWPQNDLEYLTDKSTLYTVGASMYLPHRPSFVPFRSTGNRFSRYKVGENWKCTEWPQTHLEYCNSEWLWTQSKYPAYIKYLPPRPKFRSVSLYD